MQQFTVEVVITEVLGTGSNPLCRVVKPGESYWEPKAKQIYCLNYIRQQVDAGWWMVVAGVINV